MTCYCPLIGPCETFFYSLDLMSLMSYDKLSTDNNRNYVAMINVINNAMLSATQQMSILIHYPSLEENVSREGKLLLLIIIRKTGKCIKSYIRIAILNILSAFLVCYFMFGKTLSLKLLSWEAIKEKCWHSKLYFSTTIRVEFNIKIK